MKRQILMRILSFAISFMLVFGTVYAENQTINDEQTITSEQQLKSENTNESENTETSGNTDEGGNTGECGNTNESDNTEGNEGVNNEGEGDEDNNSEGGTTNQPTNQISYDQLMTSIADIYGTQNTLTEWEAFDMSAYGAYMSAKGETSFAKISDVARQNYVNQTINALNGTGVYASERAKGELILKSLGYDSTKLYPVNSSTAIDNATLLRNETYLGDYTTAVWLLLANLQGKLNLPAEKITASLDMIEVSLTDGVLSFSWDGYSFPDPDTTGWAVAALTGLKNNAQFAERANALTQTMVSGLSNSLLENGSYGNVNSDAMVITGLLAVGIDPYTDARFVKENGNLGDALKLYINETDNGFNSAYPGGEALATEQGFRALVALERFKWQNAPYNIYAPDVTSLVPAYAVGSGTTSVPSAPPAESSDITVTFEMTGYNSTWISRKNTTVKEGAKVYHLLKKMFEENNMTADGIDNGYIKSVTWSGTTLGQFDKGVNSGWLYYVNGTLPSVGIADYTLNDGDVVKLVYTTDYVETMNGGFNVSSSNSSSGGATVEDKKEDKKEDKTEEKDNVTDTEHIETIPSAGFADVDDDAPYTKAVDYLYAKGIMNGTGNNKFSPDISLSRAMIVTVLYRLDGEPEVKGESEFGDLTEDWYKKAVSWANENGIVNGTSKGVFSPDDMIIGEHLSLIIDRYASYKGIGVTESDELAELVSENTSPEYGSEWIAMTLARHGGYGQWLNKYYENIEKYVENNNGILDNRKNTEYSRLILALSAMGKDAKNVAGYNLLMPLGDYDKTIRQGINGAIWALIALDSMDYEIPLNPDADTQATRDMYIKLILDSEVENGGWALSGDALDPDVTAMALVALSSYRDREDVSAAIDRALEKMSDIQDENGGYASWNTANSESSAQMLVALCALGISVDDERFVKNKNTLLDNIAMYKTEGGYKHTLSEESANVYATEQCFYALEAYERFESGKGSLFDMTQKPAISYIESEPQKEVTRSQTAMIFYEMIEEMK